MSEPWIRLTQVLAEVGEREPFGGVHVRVVAVADVLLVDDVGVDPFRAEASAQGEEEVTFESARELIHETGLVVGEEQQLALMRLGHCVAFETVLKSKSGLFPHAHICRQFEPKRDSPHPDTVSHTSDSTSVVSASPST